MAALSTVLAVVAIAFLVVLIAYLRLRRTASAAAHELAPVESEEEQLALKIWLSKKQLETTFDALIDRICVIDTDFTILRVNKAYADDVGRRIRAILGKKCHMVFFGRKEPCDACPALVTMAQGSSRRECHFMKVSEGDERHFRFSTYPVFDEAEKIINVIEHIREITDERRMNEQLIRSEKLAGIGILTAGIAHEMNNPLSGISGTAENMLSMHDKYGLNDKGMERMATILECSQRASAIMKDLLRLSQKQEVIRQQVDLRQLVRKCVDAVSTMNICPFTVTYALDEPVSKVRCDPSKVEQVLMQVIKNGAQAIADKRKKCRREGVEFEGVLTVNVRSSDKEIICEIIDNGIGIAPDAESKIFDPFYTTRPPGKGTGLGLSICYRIIEEHHGQISVVTRKELTTATIVLPISRDPLTDIEARITTRRTANGA